MWELAVTGVALFGTLPVPAGGGEIQPRVSGRRWTVRLSTAAVVSPSVRLGSGTFRAIAWMAAPDACGRFPAGAATLRVCAGAEAGFVWARGRGYARPRDTLVPHVAPMAALEVAAPVGPSVSLLAGARLAVPILRARFVVGDDLRASGWPVSVLMTAGVAFGVKDPRAARSNEGRPW
jgi:hypothetical protein